MNFIITGSSEELEKIVKEEGKEIFGEALRLSFTYSKNKRFVAITGYKDEDKTKTSYLHVYDLGEQEPCEMGFYSSGGSGGNEEYIIESINISDEGNVNYRTKDGLEHTCLYRKQNTYHKLKPGEIIPLDSAQKLIAKHFGWDY